MIMNLNEIQRIPPVGVQSRERGRWERGRMNNSPCTCQEPSHTLL